MKKLIIAIGGASGVIYGVRLLEILKDLRDVQTHLVMSRTAQINLRVETDWSVDQVRALADETYKPGDLAAPVSSGSFRTDGMIVAACSMKTLSGVVNSYADDLIVRAADVCLKDRRRLVLMPRETPLHEGHCRLMYEASKLGAIIAPPMPAFYQRPESLDDMVTQTAGRVLDLFDIDAGVVSRWAGAASPETP
ncbi:3-octaprenyl-4-hydroxybenzoate carboxy-lyase [Marinicauda salina]|uniref:Flavin prenyltransferase UbiX n=1 Tax=Marinicauda salina TaxID=2135793 RepID=A0A2U2BWX4_9PROT|nr:UbiX family flavin prenyltransferase [Marinicauda salina]PWE18479.1 3-octaprenyl-4-hydroxybenzoate carboxy-lyase [Marinicauda salina]